MDKKFIATGINSKLKYVSLYGKKIKTIGSDIIDIIMFDETVKEGVIAYFDGTTYIEPNISDNCYYICKIINDRLSVRYVISADTYCNKLRYNTHEEKLSALAKIEGVQDTGKNKVFSHLASAASFELSNEISDFSYFSIMENYLPAVFEILQHKYPPEIAHAIKNEINIMESSHGDTRSCCQRKIKALMSIDTITQKKVTLTREEVKDILKSDFYCENKSIEDFIVDIIISLMNDKKPTPILLAGPNSCGKKTVFKTIAKMLGVKSKTIDCRAISTSDDLIGCSSDFSSSSWGCIIDEFVKSKTTNIALCFSELCSLDNDKEQHGNPLQSICSIFSEAREINDNFMPVSISTKNTYVFATTEEPEKLPENILSCFKVIYIPSLNDRDKANVLREHVLPKMYEEKGINERIQLSEKVLQEIAYKYTDDCGISELKNKVDLLITRYRHDNENKSITTKYVDKVFAEFENSGRNQLMRFFKDNINDYHPEKKKKIERLFNKLKHDLSDDERELTELKLQCLTRCVKKVNDPFDYDDFLLFINNTHYGMENAKNALAERLLINSLGNSGHLSGAAILFTGDYGVGKTTLAKSVAKALNNRGVIEFNCQSLLPSDITGTKLEPSVFVKNAMAICSSSPVIILNELGLMPLESQKTLIDILDNQSIIYDIFTDDQYDFSDSLIIGTSNNDGSNKILPSLLDRMERIQIERYDASDKERILSDFLIKRVTSNLPYSFEFEPDAIRLMCAEYSQECGVRQLENNLDKVIRKFVVENRNQNRNKSIAVTPGDVIDVLGEPPIARGNIPKENFPGAAKGLAVTGNEGMAFAVITTLINDEENVVITGLPEQDVKDSVKKAVTFVKINFPNALKNKGLHVDFSEGSIPKSGSSAGLAIAFSIISAITRRCIDNCAFTGEINPHGDVFAIGGLDLKIEGAKRAGINKLYIPYDNRNNECVISNQDDMEIIPVRNICEIIDMALI